MPEVLGLRLLLPFHQPRAARERRGAFLGGVEDRAMDAVTEVASSSNPVTSIEAKDDLF